MQGHVSPEGDGSLWPASLYREAADPPQYPPCLGSVGEQLHTMLELVCCPFWGAPEQMACFPQKLSWKLEVRYMENITSSCNYTGVVNTLMDFGVESRAAVFTLPQVALVTTCSQGAAFCFTWSTWRHSMVTPPGLWPQVTHKHLHHLLHLVQKFSIQVQIWPHPLGLLNTNLEQQTMKYLEGIHEVDICWRHQALLSCDHPPWDNLWDTHQEWLCSSPTLCNILSPFISYGDCSITQLYYKPVSPVPHRLRKQSYNK